MVDIFSGSTTIMQETMGGATMPLPGTHVESSLVIQPFVVSDTSYGKSTQTLDASIALRNLPVKSYCYATKSSNQAIATATGTTVTLDTFDTNNYTMSVTADRIIIPESGQYLVSSLVQWATNATGSRDAYLRLNGSTTFADVYTAPNAADLTTSVITTIRTFTAGDYIQLRVFHNAGVNVNVNSGIANTFLSVHQL